MKKIIALLLSVLLVLGSFSAVAEMTVVTKENKVLYKQGDKGKEVSTIRERLYELQYITGNYHASESYSSSVTESVTSFQKKNGLTATGKVDQETWDLLFSDHAINALGVVWNENNNHNATSNYCLLGDEQFYAGSDGNVIVIILDTFPSSYFDILVKSVSDYADGLEDFTYYDNYDSCYIGTYPSMAHLLTGYELNTDVTIGQWFHDAWTSDSAQYFYGKLKEYGYDSYFYSVAPSNCGIKSEAMAYFSNLVRISDYSGNASSGKVSEDFYTYVQDGVTVVPGKRFIVQHLKGLHYPYLVDTNGNKVKSSTTAKSIEGWWKITKTYLEQLKAAGVYDNSTIIITTDHGTKLTSDLQSIFLIKEAGKTGTGLTTNSAPVSHAEFISTVLSCIGVPEEELPDKSIYDFS